MATARSSADDRDRPKLSPSTAQIAGWMVVGALNALALGLTVPLPREGLSVRVWHHAYEAGHVFALGLLSASLVAIWGRWTRGPLARRAAAMTALGALAMALSFALLGPDTIGAAGKLSGMGSATLWHAGMLALIGALVPLSATLGDILSRWRAGRALGLALACASAFVNNLALRYDYPGIHLYWAWCTAVFAATCLVGLPVPRIRSGIGASVRAALALFAAASLIVPPTNAVQLQLFRLSGSPLNALLARARFHAATLYVSGENAWRPSTVATPPSLPRLLPESPIVILLTVDALRADVVRGGKYKDLLPNLEALRLASVEFERAHSPASGTIWTLASIFSGKYYSQLHWTVKSDGVTKKVYPHEDLSPRFPEILASSGTLTINGSWSLPDTVNAYGVLRGFIGERYAPYPYPTTETLMNSLIASLRSGEAHPLFLYAHFMEAHPPYDRAGDHGSPFANYLHELASFDVELGRLLALLDEPARAGRSVVMVTADHGEAFGEHQMRYHGYTVYSELVDVPLLIRGPMFARREVYERVTLMDLGPTILDLMGRPTPPGMMGQSLVPFLRGEQPKLSRPIVMDTGRLQRAMIFDDDLKIIEDRRKDTIELYDLAADPGELIELSDVRPEEARARLEVLRGFFRAHEFVQEGYETPYRP